jgi:hypothetical protein
VTQIYAEVVAALYAWVRRHPRLVDGVLAAALLLTGVVPALAKGMIAAVPLGLGLAVPVVFAYETGLVKVRGLA